MPGQKILVVDDEDHILELARLYLSREGYQIAAVSDGAQPPGRVFQRAELLDLVWGYDFPGYTRTVDVHVQQLREKLAAGGVSDPVIQTVWGVGYKLEMAET